MTFNPPSLKALGSYWVKQGGVNLGVVGDTRHLATGTSYHLGKSALSSDAYSRRTARDKAGLTEAASAIDLGRLDGSLGHLREFSIWLVAQARANAPGTSDIREIIYTPDGLKVYGWSREAGVASKPIKGYGDSSHITHTHISFYRDSELRAKVALFRPYFTPTVTPPVPAPPQEANVTVVTITLFPTPRAFTASAPLRRFSATAELSGSIAAPYSATVDGTVQIEGNPGIPRGSGFLRIASGGSRGRYILAAQVVVEDS